MPCVLKLLAKSASAAAAQIHLHSACLAVAWRLASFIVVAPMCFSFLTVALVASVPISLYASPAWAGPFALLFGTRRPYEGPWCAYMNTGAGRVEEDCTFKSLAACRQMVISGNRGFCTQNPAFIGYYEQPIRKTKRVYNR